MGSNVEQAIQACRKCPLHQDPAQANPIGSRPEDFLATDKQKSVCDEVLARSLTCNWENIPPPPQKRAEDVGSGMIRLPFDRSSTPKNLNDVRMLDTIFEHEPALYGQPASSAGQMQMQMPMGPFQSPLRQRG
ncbi:hypothetical protein HRR86_006698 [Exophiala dermatitidis]|nr:hypothetical protein HRR77_004176 [Exophiala dermatitidis]KAJ4575598.1 hypothetical protein HRR79_002508 [Exophiala dermatitidis]KAJ4587332.1 hypothetical protein HRR82_001148 [Exophiala dermatitidis]KAJ4613855.1 hypothetical protein HRR85_004144 [Exophiala dermatitidis]KAJ4619990.1 hypothetical protein HRR86_006698 [Exophiala dermatitidis]